MFSSPFLHIHPTRNGTCIPLAAAASAEALPVVGEGLFFSLVRRSQNCFYFQFSFY
jgi:hypothetical protein